MIFSLWKNIVGFCRASHNWVSTQNDSDVPSSVVIGSNNNWPFNNIVVVSCYSYIKSVCELFITLYAFVHTLGMLLPPLVMIETVFNAITLWWPPVSGYMQCGQVSYLVTITPAHGTLREINDTFYMITGLDYNTTYSITVLATSDVGGDSDPTNITVETISLQSMHECNLMLYVATSCVHAVVCNPYIATTCIIIKVAIKYGS